MISSHTLPCLFLGITIDAKETKDTIPSDASIFSAKFWGRKVAKNYI
jgi:hypothetical protein